MRVCCAIWLCASVARLGTPTSIHTGVVGALLTVICLVYEMVGGCFERETCFILRIKVDIDALREILLTVRVCGFKSNVKAYSVPCFCIRTRTASGNRLQWAESMATPSRPSKTLFLFWVSWCTESRFRWSYGIAHSSSIWNCYPYLVVMLAGATTVDSYNDHLSRETCIWVFWCMKPLVFE